MSLPGEWQAHLEQQLHARKSAGLLRVAPVAHGKSGSTRQLNGRSVRNFASNDYLGLASHPRVAAALAEATETYGVGSGASAVIGGYTTAHQGLENQLAEWLDREEALVFHSGYAANLAIFSVLADVQTTVIADKLCHASMIDGVKLGEGALKRFVHNRIDSAERQSENCAGRAILATESVFSMDGDMAPLAQLDALAQQREALLVIDEAHAIGTFGKTGAGLAQDLSGNHIVVMATLGKAVGVAGAVVAGPSIVIEALRQFSRSHIYTTASLPAQLAATMVAVELVKASDDKRARLRRLIEVFRTAAQAQGLALLNSDTAIQPVVLRDSERAVQVSQRLFDLGFYVPAVRPPTVPANSARLRVSLSAAHSEEDVAALVAAMAKIIVELD